MPATPFEGADRTVAAWGTEVARERVRGFETLAYPQRARSVVEVLDMSLRWGEREFVVAPEVRLSYRALHSAVDDAADRLVERGLRPGGPVLLLAANSPEWIVAFWAVLRVGGIVVLGNGWWSRAETAHAIGLTEPALAAVDGKRAASVDGLVPTFEIDELGPLVRGQAGGRASAGGGLSAARPVVDEDDPAVVLFTSGTSGPPKGAVLSHRSILANQHNFLALTRRLPSQIADDHPAVRVLISAPLFHTGGVQAIVSGMLTGTTLVLLTGRFDPTVVVETMERERISAWTGVPTAVQRVVEHPDALTRDLSSVRSLGMGGAPLPTVLVERAAAAFPGVRRGVSTNYGMTEAGGIVASASGEDVTARPGTSGRVLPAVEVRIDAEQGPGEILVRSAALMSGYWGEVESPFTAEGWLRTGDVGVLDDGHLYVVDRIKDIVIRGGENIASAHVEAALLRHPAVAAAAVIGLPHNDLGEEVAAVLRIREGEQVTDDQLVGFLRGELAHFEVPTRWWRRPGPFPVTATDKTDKRALRAEWPDG